MISMEKKFKITYNESNVQGSVAYVLVKEFDLTPNVLKANISGDGSGIMIVSVVGDEATIDKGMERVKECGYSVCPVMDHIHKDEEKCWSCGACVSVCPTKSIVVDDDYKVVVNYSSCIACGSCIDACSVKALRLVI